MEDMEKELATSDGTRLHLVEFLAKEILRKELKNPDRYGDKKITLQKLKLEPHF